ncbi:hypothetical protein C0J27_04665 [Candidatus Chromulinivorax destructor]|uniref:Uncharacterized protein n=1 Tax=Candidatus Chromulinivorax destructor TaxID=2066483 RepID=A0A345ZCH9_9BACT|nr:hypothetical protein C0J27_04665 [Candidatus Chromulinivorax destructor]
MAAATYASGDERSDIVGLYATFKFGSHSLVHEQLNIKAIHNMLYSTVQIKFSLSSFALHFLQKLLKFASR